MTRSLAPGDIVDLRIIGQIDLSPDGATVAFVEGRYDLDADETVWSIWTIASDRESAPRRLTSGAPRDSLPRWSPDGRLVAFLSARDEPWRQDLHVVAVETGAVRRVATLPRGIEAFRWSPSGDGFALLGRPAYPHDARFASATSDEERRRRYLQRVIHVERFNYRTPTAFVDDEPAQLWWCPLDGEAGPLPLTDDPYPVSEPAFAPDGRLTFVSSREPDYDRTGLAQIWAIDRNGGPPEALTGLVNQLRGYAIGDDGTVAYIALPVSSWSFGSHDPHLYVNGKDVTESLDRPTSRASEVQSTTVDYLAATQSPAMGPGGSLYFHVVDAGCAHVYRWRDGEVEPVVTGRRLVGDFSPRASTLAFTASSPDEPVALWAADPDGANERRIYDPNRWLAEREVGDIRHLAVPLDDGTTMDTWVVLPAGYTGGRLPAVLDIHPGPHSSFPWDHRTDHRIVANAGFAVVSCNQPGSQGYGEEYARRLDARWGDEDLPAYLLACDAAVDAGLVDPDRIGVSGATYGGFAALWALAHTDRFKAAVVNRAITDLEAMYADADCGWSFLPASLGAEPWEDPELYRHLSPVNYVEQITAPVRLLAFAGNQRTTVAASEAIFLRLRKLGRVTDMLVFPPGSASVYMPNRPWSKVRLLEATVEWFDRFL